ncbi:MAG: hypothetical protein RBU45_26245 [Myxococcota bacterium]|jgi:DNA-directed RNA polymerase subunit M/transcription elongation factor TFIIS|nr:hypothetical protein [Myxococcota bacterium]
MQITVMCPGCARLLTVKMQDDKGLIVCPTCGWKGRRDDKGDLIEEAEAGGRG